MCVLSGTNDGWKLLTSPDDVGLGTKPNKDFETRAEATLRDHIAGKLLAGSRARIASRRHQRWVTLPRDGNKDWNLSCRAGENQFAEVSIYGMPQSELVTAGCPKAW